MSKQLLRKINVLDLVDCDNVEFIYRLQIIFNRRLMDLHTYVSIYVQQEKNNNIDNNTQVKLLHVICIRSIIIKELLR